MINWQIASVWQNWIIVFLMFAIPATIIHLILMHTEMNGENENGE